MRQIKVAHVITRLELGGAQQNTLYTLSHLDPGHFAGLLVSGAGGVLDAELDALREKNKFKARLLPDLVREISPGQDLLAFWQLANFFANEKPDVVHTHSSKAGILGRLAAWLCGVPVIIHTYHGFGFNDFQSAWRKRLYVLMERFCCRLTDAIIFVSKANEQYARKHGIGQSKRYRLIRSGIKLSDYPAAIEDRGRKKTSLGVGMHKLLIVSIGNLKPQKNAGDFLAMAEKVHGDFPDAEFLFIGDGPMRQKLEARILASGLSNRVKLAGWRRDTPEILAVSDIFVLTSLWEGLPRSLVEAMKSGIAPVCYKTDGVSDLVQDGVNGFLTPPGDVQALANRVERLIKDESLRRSLGQRAAQSISTEFDIDLMVRRQEDLYFELLSKYERN